MNWFAENLPFMLVVTISILAILGVGMWHEYSSKAYENIEREENDGLYMPHVAQGIRSECEQKSVEHGVLPNGDKKTLVKSH